MSSAPGAEGRVRPFGMELAVPPVHIVPRGQTMESGGGSHDDDGPPPEVRPRL